MTKGTNDIRTLLNEIEQLKRDLDDAVGLLDWAARWVANNLTFPSDPLSEEEVAYGQAKMLRVRAFLAKHPAPEVKE